MGIIFSIQSCTQDGGTEATDNLKAPTLPPVSMFAIPTQAFGLVGDKESSSTRNSKSNWLHAGLNVLVWNSVVFVNTAIPIAAFGHAFEYEADYIGNKTFEWKYEYQTEPAQGSKKYDVSLTGQYISNQEEVAWTMTVTAQGTTNSFVWYEGIVDVDNSEGVFTVNKNPQNPEPYMEISYKTEPAKSNATIRFSNVTANDPGVGDYIEWRAQNDEEFDRAYDVFTNDNLLEIQGIEGLKTGRVKDSNHFNDADWHCWDESHTNMDC